jgi:hypothetical protein
MQHKPIIVQYVTTTCLGTTNNVTCFRHTGLDKAGNLWKFFRDTYRDDAGFEVNGDPYGFTLVKETGS